MIIVKNAKAFQKKAKKSKTVDLLKKLIAQEKMCDRDCKKCVIYWNCDNTGWEEVSIQGIGISHNILKNW